MGNNEGTDLYANKMYFEGKQDKISSATFG